jgi:zinc transporter ZupT
VIGLATLSPTPGLREFLAYGLVGLYVGVIPVGLGLLWYPALKRLGRRWLEALLALTIGLLVFLLIDTFLEAIEAGGALPGVFQGVPLALFAALLTWLTIKALSAQGSKGGQGKERSPLYLSGLIALSIGLHNLGVGLAVGAAFALGEAALGSFLVIGFILHNITEGIGIAAPLVPPRRAGQADASAQQAARLAAFGGLAMLAGFPAVIGAWIGGFTSSPILAVLFLGVGMGAILQVIVEVAGLLRRYAERDQTPWISWPNLAGFVAGLAPMYFTAFLVKF